MKKRVRPRQYVCLAFRSAKKSFNGFSYLGKGDIAESGLPPHSLDAHHIDDLSDIQSAAVTLTLGPVGEYKRPLAPLTLTWRHDHPLYESTAIPMGRVTISLPFESSLLVTFIFASHKEHTRKNIKSCAPIRKLE